MLYVLFKSWTVFGIISHFNMKSIGFDRIFLFSQVWEIVSICEWNVETRISYDAFRYCWHSCVPFRVLLVIYSCLIDIIVRLRKEWMKIFVEEESLIWKLAAIHYPVESRVGHIAIDSSFEKRILSANWALGSSWWHRRTWMNMFPNEVQPMAHVHLLKASLLMASHLRYHHHEHVNHKSWDCFGWNLTTY